VNNTRPLRVPWWFVTVAEASVTAMRMRQMRSPQAVDMSGAYYAKSGAVVASRAHVEWRGSSVATERRRGAGMALWF